MSCGFNKYIDHATTTCNELSIGCSNTHPPFIRGLSAFCWFKKWEVPVCHQKGLWGDTTY
eukprot:1918120-Amphidinium_carterae.2